MKENFNELKQLLEEIRFKTGVDVRFEPGSDPEIEFPLEIGGETVNAYLSGEGESVRRTARLLQYLVGGDLRQPLPEKGEYLRNILLGEGGGWAVYRFMTKYKISDSPCYAIELTVDKREKEALSHLETCLSDSKDLAVAMDETKIGVVKFADEATTPIEFCGFLVQSLYEELGLKANVGVGCEVKSFSEIARSYHQAATAMRMSGLLKSKGEVHTYREYLLVKMLEEIPQERLKEYLEQFRVSGMEEIFADEEMIGTAEEFLENSLNISETSRNLFMHRNTLMYRLDKIERITGLNLRKFSDAVTFRVITVLHKLIQ